MTLDPEAVEWRVLVGERFRISVIVEALLFGMTLEGSKIWRPSWRRQAQHQHCEFLRCLEVEIVHPLTSVEYPTTPKRNCLIQ